MNKMHYLYQWVAYTIITMLFFVAIDYLTSGRTEANFETFMFIGFAITWAFERESHRKKAN